VGRAEERRKRVAREIVARWARLFAATMYSSDGPLSQYRSPRFIIINKTQI
jgi:hypothetical protein